MIHSEQDCSNLRINLMQAIKQYYSSRVDQACLRFEIGVRLLYE